MCKVVFGNPTHGDLDIKTVKSVLLFEEIQDKLEARKEENLLVYKMNFRRDSRKEDGNSKRRERKKEDTEERRNNTEDRQNKRSRKRIPGKKPQYDRDKDHESEYKEEELSGKVAKTRTDTKAIVAVIENESEMTKKRYWNEAAQMYQCKGKKIFQGKERNFNKNEDIEVTGNRATIILWQRRFGLVLPLPKVCEAKAKLEYCTTQHAWTRTNATLTQKRWWECIDPRYADDSDNWMQMQLQRNNDDALSYITQREDNLERDIIVCTKAKEAWDILSDIHTKMDTFQIVDVLEELCNSRKTEKMSMKDYIAIDNEETRNNTEDRQNKRSRKRISGKKAQYDSDKDCESKSKENELSGKLAKTRTDTKAIVAVIENENEMTEK
ncbi:myb-like protein X [Palaemon carinicauda]|uniref:myb-like protein X n=1 Tax=Palaemon carinicauda TaxID=392227 RepID=UPI0035B6932B